MSKRAKFEYGRIGDVNRWQAKSLDDAEMSARRASAKWIAASWGVWDAEYIAPRCVFFRGVRYAPELEAQP